MTHLPTRESTGIVDLIVDFDELVRKEKRRSYKEELNAKQEIKRTCWIHQTHNLGNSLSKCENPSFCIFKIKALFKLVVLFILFLLEKYQI